MSTTNRQKLREAITQAGPGAENALAAKDVGRLAIELSSRYPQSGLTIDAIEDEIRLAHQPKTEDAKTEVIGGA